MVFMLNIVLRAFDRISERIIGLHDCVKERTIAGVRIVGMVALSKITKHPLYRSRVGVRADFQYFVIVDELRGFHHMPPYGPLWYFGAFHFAALWVRSPYHCSYAMSTV